MKNFKLLDCKRSDCRFTISNTFRNAVYYEPVYDKEGNNINPRVNATHGNLNCSSCNRNWKFTDSYTETTYEEIK